MKQQINEIKRMQQLANIKINESDAYSREEYGNLLNKTVEITWEGDPTATIGEIVQVGVDGFIKIDDKGSRWGLPIGIEALNQLVSNGEWNAPSGNPARFKKITVM